MKTKVKITDKKDVESPVKEGFFSSLPVDVFSWVEDKGESSKEAFVYLRDLSVEADQIELLRKLNLE